MVYALNYYVKDDCAMIEMKNNTLRKKLIRLAALLMLLALTINTAGCSGFPPKVSAENLMEQIKPNPVDGKTTDSQFINSTADFIVELFKKSVDDKKISRIPIIGYMLYYDCKRSRRRNPGSNGKGFGQGNSLMSLMSTFIIMQRTCPC